MTSRRILKLAAAAWLVGITALIGISFVRSLKEIHRVPAPMPAKEFLQGKGLAASDVGGIYMSEDRMGARSWWDQLGALASGRISKGKWEWQKYDGRGSTWNIYTWSDEVADKAAAEITLVPERGIIIRSRGESVPAWLKEWEEDHYRYSQGSMKELKGMGYWANTVFPSVKRFILHRYARGDFGSRATLSFEVEDAHQWIADVAKSATATGVWMDNTWPKDSKIISLIDLLEPYDGHNLVLGEQIIHLEPSDNNRLVTIQVSRD